MNHNIHVPKEKLGDLCKRFHISKLSLFGSILRDDFNENSDVDVLVDFEPGHVPGFIKLYRIEKEFSSLFGGRKIDLVTTKALNRRLRDRILNTAEVQYA